MSDAEDRSDPFFIGWAAAPGRLRPFLAGVGLCLAVLFPMTMLPKVFFALPMAIVMLLILGAGRFFSWFTNEDRLRKLALYITFTDEFVVEPEEDGEA